MHSSSFFACKLLKYFKKNWFTNTLTIIASHASSVSMVIGLTKWCSSGMWDIIVMFIWRAYTLLRKYKLLYCEEHVRPLLITWLDIHLAVMAITLCKHSLRNQAMLSIVFIVFLHVFHTWLHSNAIVCISSIKLRFQINITIIPLNSTATLLGESYYHGNTGCM